MYTGIGSLKTNSNWLRIPSALSNRSAKVRTSADSTKCATRRDLCDLYMTSTALWLLSDKNTIRPSCDDKSALSANATSLSAVTLKEFQSRQGARADALWLYTYLITFFKR